MLTGSGLMLLHLHLCFGILLSSSQLLKPTTDSDAFASATVVISNDGRDDAGCGQPQQPCRSMATALALAGIGGTVVVGGGRMSGKSGAGGGWDWLCGGGGGGEPVVIRHSVTLQGADSLSRIGCPFPGPRMMMFNITANRDLATNTGNGTVVVFAGLHVTGSVVYASNVSVRFVGCVVENSRIQFTEASPRAELIARNSLFRGTVDEVCAVNCGTSTVLDIRGSVIHVALTNSTFLHTSSVVVARSVLTAHVTGCTFDAVPEAKNQFLGGVQLTVTNEVHPSRVVIRDSTFENLLHNDPVQSVMNLLDAALLIRVTDTRRHLPGSNVTVDVIGCRFGFGERGVTVVGPYRSIRVSDCVFYENVAMQAGAAILYLTEASSPSVVVNCSFRSNAGGAFRPQQLKDHLQAFQVNQDEVRVHSSCCKGIIAFVGKGGAVRIQRGNLTLVSCHFFNNTARLLGGAVYVDRDSYLFVNHVTFENSESDLHSLEGDLIYSNGNVYINGARFVALTASNHVAVVRHSGEHWSIEVTSVFIQCPVGYRLRVSNSSAYQVTAIGLMRSYRMDQLSYFCESCPRNKYSLDFGYLNYTNAYNTVSYYTLFVNGRRPEQDNAGSYEYHDIACLQCPYGGKCQHGISALPNFWGYINTNRVRFQRCPRRYCCSSSDCKEFNRCARHRTGTLCGHCVPGYSEALFSPDCVPDSECDPTWLFPVMMSSGILYFLFLLYQKDVRDLMFLHNDVIRKFYCSCNWPARKRTSNKNVSELDRIQLNSATTSVGISGESFGLPAIRMGRHDDGDTSSRDLQKHLLNDLHQQPDPTSSSSLDPPANGSSSSGGGGGGGGGGPAAAAPPPPPPPPDRGASFLIIVFFYFQDAQLLHINTGLSTRDNKAIVMFKEILSGLFKFRIEFFQFIDQMCFLDGLDATTKLLIRALLVPYVLLQFGLVYLIYTCCSETGMTRAPGGARGNADPDNPSSSSSRAPTSKFAISLTTGFVLALLFTYQKLATTSLTLLNCVPVGDRSVLFIDGSIDCYQLWQYPVIVYTGTCIVPFCLVLLIGPGLLKDGLVSLTQFFLATIIPLPFLAYWLWIRLVRRPPRPPPNTKLLSAASQAMLQILQGPFKESEVPYLGPICGQGILIGRRLVLVLLFTFVNDILIRTLCMMLLCFIILLHHAHVLPYKDRQGNWAGTASAAALVVIVGINLVRAAFEAAEYIPHGPNETLMKVFDEVEDTLMLWMPGAVMGFVILSLTVKIVLLTIKHISTCGGGRGGGGGGAAAAAGGERVAIR